MVYVKTQFFSITDSVFFFLTGKDVREFLLEVKVNGTFFAGNVVHTWNVIGSY